VGRAHRRQRVVILTYHGVLPGDHPGHRYLSRNFVAVDQFDRHMRLLRDRYTCLPLAEVVDRLAGGLPLPPNTAVVTFDDGFRNNLTVAYPVLEAHGIPATIFVTTGHVGTSTMLWTERVQWLLAHSQSPLSALDLGPLLNVPPGSSYTREETARRLVGTLKHMPAGERSRIVERLEHAIAAHSLPTPDPVRYEFLSWDEVAWLDRTTLVDIGSHTVSHLILSTGTPQQRLDELATSKAAIEKVTNRPCRLFAYPNGTARDFDSQDKEFLRSLDYRCAASQIPGCNDANTDLYALRRYNVGSGHDERLLEALLAGVWPAGGA
jgi:peptidoglycan/xylan/chitin deacetylase (PgdA/CDA1 family)